MAYTEYTRLSLKLKSRKKKLENAFSLDVMSPLNTRLPYRKINNLFYSFQMTNHILQKNSHMVMLWNDDIWIFYPWQSQQFPVNVVFGVFDIFTILGNIAIYFRHKPSYDLTAVVKKKFITHLGSNFSVFWKRRKKETIRPEIQVKLAPQLSDNLLNLYIFRIVRIELVRAKNIFANNLVPKVD